MQLGNVKKLCANLKGGGKLGSITNSEGFWIFKIFVS